MSLDYEFAPVDVSIASHPRALKAKCLAMGLWLWGQCYAKRYAPDGHLTYEAVLSAWGDSPATIRKAAAALVASGLWIAREDGGWDIHNFVKKGPGERLRSISSSAVRMARKRERERERDASSDASPPSQSDASQVTVTSISNSLSTSGSGSLSDRVAPPDGSMPAWFEGACDAAAMTIGGDIDERPGLWVQYLASRRRKTWAMDHTDAVGWIVPVVQSARAKARAGPAPKHVQSSENRAWIVPKEMP